MQVVKVAEMVEAEKAKAEKAEMVAEMEAEEMEADMAAEQVDMAADLAEAEEMEAGEMEAEGAEVKDYMVEGEMAAELLEDVEEYFSPKISYKLRFLHVQEFLETTSNLDTLSYLYYIHKPQISNILSL